MVRQIRRVRAREERRAARTGSAVLYVRVSHREQVRHGHSLDAQEVQLADYCQRRGVEVAETIVDAGVSAGRPLAKREGGRRLVELTRAPGISAVVALKLDRLFRNVRDCLETVQQWERAGTALHLLNMGGQALDTGSAVGRVFLTLMAGFAAFERDVIAERIQGVKEHEAALGRYLGGPVPYGWAVDPATRQLDRDEKEQAVIVQIRFYHAEKLSPARIARRLNLRGIPARGGRWHRTSVVRLLKDLA